MSSQLSKTMMIEKMAHRTNMSSVVSFLALTALFTSAALAQERPLQPVVQGDIGPGVPQTYTFHANAGDLIFGSLEQKGLSGGQVALYDLKGSKLKVEPFYDDPRPTLLGLVAPKTGDYRVQISATGTAAGSYTLRTRKQTPSERMKGVAPVTPVVRFKSHRITQLVDDVKAQRANAVERFWGEAQAHGGPIIETIAGDDKYVLVTFLWKEIYETHNVLALWQSFAPEEDYLTHLLGTNVWYKTVRVFRGSRLWYALAPNHRSDDRDNEWGSLTAQLDPLNPYLFIGESGSVLETPGAPDESWWRNTPPARGAITEHRLDSVLLKKPRDVSVYTPPGYSPSSGPYPLLVLFDGRAYLDFMNVATTLDNLIAQHRIRPPIVCFISDSRGVSVNPDQNPDQRPTYADSMATELVPWLRSSYSISADPKDVVIGGYSASAVMSTYVALHYPTVFGNALLQSGGAGNLLRLLIDAPKVPVRFYIDYGLYELGPWVRLAPDERPYSEPAILVSRRVRDILQAKGYNVIYRETGGAHDMIHWRATLAEGLIALLGQQTN
jgi:enterochelin esterase family protein